MAIKSDNEVISSDDEFDLSYNELHSVFETLCDEYKKLGSEYSLLKKNHACLLIKKDTLEKKACIVVDDCDKMNQHKEENKALKKTVDKLNTTLAKFTKGSKIFKTILASKNVFSTTEV
jgi:hypothetical protein